MIAERAEQPFKVFNKDESTLLGILKAFKINAESINVFRGRFFDDYDIVLAPGTRVSRVERCLVDIGLALGARSVPIGTVIMKDGVYRISVQRGQILSPNLSDLIKSSWADSNSKLSEGKWFMPISLGVSASGDRTAFDLADVPNMLVAGTTGSGKSILLHGMIISLLSNGTDVYISDPKMVEFDRYSGISGVKKIASSVEDTLSVIEELTSVMNNRFSILRKKGFRSAKDIYLSSGDRSFMKPICLAIDEWADLVLQDKNIQKKLCFLAQKGRAAGISIILSTQRPSSSVISGLIKANFPGRIGLRVASAVDSRVILDHSGAEKLTDVGMGLFLDGKSQSPLLFRAPNIVDISSEMNNLGLKKSVKNSFWRRLGFK